jgi:hypothetical protein
MNERATEVAGIRFPALPATGEKFGADRDKAVAAGALFLAVLGSGQSNFSSGMGIVLIRYKGTATCDRFKSPPSFVIASPGHGPYTWGIPS